MDFKFQEWEGRAYEYGLKILNLQGFPTEGLTFDNQMVNNNPSIFKFKNGIIVFISNN